MNAILRFVDVALSRAKQYALVTFIIVMAVWAWWMFEAVMASPRPAVTITEEVKTMVIWDHQDSSGAILLVTATDADARAHEMTLSEWVAQMKEWFPPYVPPED